MSKEHAPGGCCCCPDCAVVLDMWTADTIANYTQVSGIWSVDATAHRLRLTTSPGLLIANTFHDSDDQAVGTTFLLSFGTLDQVDDFRLILRYKDADNYLYAKLVTRRTIGSWYFLLWTVSLCERRSGADATLITATEGYNAGWLDFDVYVEIRLCFVGGHLSTRFNYQSVAGGPIGQPTWLRADVSSPGDYGRKAGLAVTTNHPSKVAFAAVNQGYFEGGFCITKQEPGCVSCDPLSPVVSPGTLPRTIQLNISGVTGATWWNASWILSAGSGYTDVIFGTFWSFMVNLPGPIFCEIRLTLSCPDPKAGVIHGKLTITDILGGNGSAQSADVVLGGSCCKIDGAAVARSWPLSNVGVPGVANFSAATAAAIPIW